MATPREQLLTKKESNPKKIIRCVGTYDDNNIQVKHIFHKYWSILLADEDLKEVITPHPSLTYRRGRNIKDTLIHSHYQSQTSNSNWLRLSITGSFPCGTCSFCRYMPKRRCFINPLDEKLYDIKEFRNCKTTGVIYAAQCPCLKIYVGKTIQPLRMRICQHISTINCCEDTPLSRHVRLVHEGDPKSLQFCGITKIKLGPRRGNLDIKLLQEEAKWIFQLDSRSPKGLNKGFTYTTFL